MPFTEEAPQPICGCKNRTCPLQDNFVNVSNGKNYLRYRCSKPELWAVCLRWIDPKTKTEKQEPEPQPQQESHPEIKEAIDSMTAPQFKKPTDEQLKNRCNTYPTDCNLCAPKTQDKCGVEAEHRKPPQ